MGWTSKPRLAGLLLSMALLAAACDQPREAAGRAAPTTAPPDKPCLREVRSARPFWFRTSAGAAELRRRGADRIVLMGSSMGATAVLAATTRIRPPLAGVVSLSGPAAFGAVSAWAAMPRLRVPALFVAAADDQPFVGAARAMYRRARVADKGLLIVRRGHGSTMLAYRDEGPKVLAAVRGFIADQARR